MKHTTWSRYVEALSSNQSEIAQRAEVSQSTVSRWVNEGVVPSAMLVIKLARAYALSPVAALVASEYLRPSEIADSGVQPRRLALHEFTDHELAVEMLRRVDQGGHPELELPVDENHPAMKEHVAKLTKLPTKVSGTVDDVRLPKAASDDDTAVSEESRD